MEPSEDASEPAAASRWSVEASAEIDVMLAELERIGLVEVWSRDSHVHFRLTREGARVARLLAMGDPGDAEAVLDALLAETEL